MNGNVNMLWWLLLGLLVLAGLWPRSGLMAQLRRWRVMRQRALLEDALKHLLARTHLDRDASPDSLAGALGLSQRALLGLIARMEAAGLLQSQMGRLHLTSEGERWALRVVRAHRLWERYLADEAGLPMNQIHRAAERAEHHLTPEALDALDAHLGYPRSDPHGDPIPTAAGAVTPLQAVSLTDWPTDKPAVIRHIEDEPEVIFKQIAASGLRPGKIVRILAIDPERLIVSDGQDEYCLAPIVAANIQVAAAREAAAVEEKVVRLTDLSQGEERQVVTIDPQCRGFTRRRLLDLGLTPGARVCPELANAFGGSRAFRIRGTLIALRSEQAEKVWVR